MGGRHYRSFCTGKLRDVGCDGGGGGGGGRHVCSRCRLREERERVTCLRGEFSHGMVCKRGAKAEQAGACESTSSVICPAADEIFTCVAE